MVGILPQALFGRRESIGPARLLEAKSRQGGVVVGVFGSSRIASRIAVSASLSRSIAVSTWARK